MHNLLSKSIYHSSLAKAALLAAMALCGATTPAQAQEEVSGKFTLQGNARLGDKILAPGSYLFTIEPASSAQALGAIPAAGTPVVFIVRPEKLAGPTTVVFAMASRTEKALDASQLVLATGKKEATMQSMYLNGQKLLVEFDWMGGKDKTVMLAQAARRQGGASSKATD
ncbi:MAG: hypothetical protein DMG38_22850 [Acidobacteria bacterium]|nr:MAG: hypothetical protein DMG38_22850 [Acidobacteriota bacterium]